MLKNNLILCLFIRTITNFHAANAHHELADRDIVSGEENYQSHCASCHGVDLEGQPNWRKQKADGSLPAPPHDETGHTWHHDDQTLHSIIKYGLAKLVKNYQGKMIGFEDNLSDKEIDSVLAYIKSFWPKEEYEYQINLSK